MFWLCVVRGWLPDCYRRRRFGPAIGGAMARVTSAETPENEISAGKFFSSILRAIILTYDGVKRMGRSLKVQRKQTKEQRLLT